MRDTQENIMTKEIDLVPEIDTKHIKTTVAERSLVVAAVGAVTRDRWVVLVG